MTKKGEKKKSKKMENKSEAQKLLERSLSPPIEFQNFDSSSVISANHLHVSQPRPPVLKPITCTHVTSKSNAAGKENQQFQVELVKSSENTGTFNAPSCVTGKLLHMSF